MRATFVAASNGMSVQLDSDGSMWSWGNSIVASTTPGGQEIEGRQLSPVQLTDCEWAKVSIGALHVMALKKDGSLWAWGDDSHGELGGDQPGIGQGLGAYTPIPIGTDTWLAIAAGDGYTMGIKQDGTLWAWGDDSWGELGDGAGGGSAMVTTPEQIGTDTWTAIAVSPLATFVTLGIKKDGSLWGWGNNSFGQVGDGTGAGQMCAGVASQAYCVYAPEQIGKGQTWASVAVGEFHAMAITTTGELWAWGQDGGNVGSGNPVGPSILGYTGGDAGTPGGQCNVVVGSICVYAPEQIGTGTSWASVSGGDNFTVALQKGGTLWAWGLNEGGIAGDGQDCTSDPTTSCLISPQQVGTDTNWADIAAGANYAVAAKTDGTVWAWGGNYGNIGDGTTMQRDAPVHVP